MNRKGEQPSSRRRLPRRVKVPLIIVAVIVGLVLLAQVLVSILARPIAERRAADALGTGVQIGSLSVNLFTGRARLRDVAVDDPDGGGSGHVIEVGAVDCDVSVSALIGGRVVVRRLVIDRPMLHIRRGEDGRINLERLGGKAEAPRPPTAQKPAEPTSIRIARLRVRDGLIVYTDRSQGDPAYEMRIEALTVSADDLSTEPAAGDTTQPIEVTGTLRSGDQIGRLAVTATAASLGRPLNADVKISIEEVNLAQFPLKRGPLGDLRIRRGDVLLTGRVTCRDDALEGDQSVQVRRLQLGHSGRDIALASIFGVPVEALNAFLLATEGTLYVEFPLTGTVDEPRVRFDKALQRTVAAGPGHMLQRIAKLPGDFLTAGVDIGALLAKPLDDAAKALFDPAKWKIKIHRDTDPTRVLRSTTRAVDDALKILDPKTWGKKPRKDDGPP